MGNIAPSPLTAIEVEALLQAVRTQGGSSRGIDVGALRQDIEWIGTWIRTHYALTSDRGAKERHADLEKVFRAAKVLLAYPKALEKALDAASAGMRFSETLELAALIRDGATIERARRRASGRDQSAPFSSWGLTENDILVGRLGRSYRRHFRQLPSIEYGTDSDTGERIAVGPFIAFLTNAVGLLGREWSSDAARKAWERYLDKVSKDEQDKWVEEVGGTLLGQDPKEI